MKSLSPRACVLISHLERESSFAEKLTGRTDRDIAILRELAVYAEPAMVPHLLSSVFGHDRSVAHAAALVLDHAIREASLADLAALDETCRRGWWRGARDNWSRLQPAEVSRLIHFGDLETSVIGIASFHPNGYVREAAVTRLDSLRGGRELAFLLARVNDWVAPVAERARLAVERRLVASNADAFFDMLPLMLRLETTTRREHSGLLGQVRKLLREDDRVLQRGLASHDRFVRRIAFRLAREAERGDALQLLQLALRDVDTVIRLDAVREAVARMPTNELASALPDVVADPYPPIRREGITAAAQRLGERANPWLFDALMDRNQVVREVARFHLRRRGSANDFAALYRARIGDASAPRVLATTLAGLGESGTDADASIIEPFLAHHRPAVRQVAMRALAALDLDARFPLIVGMLQDRAASVSGASRKLLRPHANRVGLDCLRGILRDGPHPYNRFDAASLGASLSKWDSLPILLEASANHDERLRSSAARWLGAWIVKQNRSSAQPSAVQLGRVREALEAHRPAIDAHSAAEIRSVLGFWKG